MNPVEPRWHVTLVDRQTFYRHPRTKRRRIIRKWRQRPENWRPLMEIIQVTLLLGAEAHRLITPATELSPYADPENPTNPRIIEMHTKLWERIKRSVPDFAAKCDLFRLTGDIFKTLVPVTS